MGPPCAGGFSGNGGDRVRHVDAAAQLKNDARVADEFDARLRLQ